MQCPIFHPATCCTFLEFDTNGGHNGGSNYLDSLRSLCGSCGVRNGMVTGFGSWLNQDCASRVASVIGNVPAQLALLLPEAGAKKDYIASFSAVSLPGSVPFDVRHP